MTDVFTPAHNVAAPNNTFEFNFLDAKKVQKHVFII